MITLDHLCTGYDRKVVARDLNARLPGGLLVSLMGRNGVGKSTLFKTLAGFLPALGGQAMMDGTDMARLTRAEMSRRVSIVLTERVDVPAMRVTDLVGLGRVPHTGFWGRLGEDDRQAVDRALRTVGIEALAGRRVCSLSDGERQKALIAKALAQDTPVILLDEPTAYLDFQSKLELMRMLATLAHGMGKTVLMSTHDVELAVQCSDLLWLLSPEGLQTGTPGRLGDEGVIGRFFESPYAQYDAKRRVFCASL